MIIVSHHIHEIDVVVYHPYIVTHLDEGWWSCHRERQQVRAVLSLIFTTNLVKQLHEVKPLSIRSVGKFPVKICINLNEKSLSDVNKMQNSPTPSSAYFSSVVLSDWMKRLRFTWFSTISEKPVDSSAPPTHSITLSFSFFDFSTLLSLNAFIKSASMTKEQLEISMIPMFKCVHSCGLMSLIFSVDSLSLRFELAYRGVV